MREPLSPELEKVIQMAVARTATMFNCKKTGRHIWWTEQQTNYTHCAYCDAVKGR